MIDPGPLRAELRAYVMHALADSPSRPLSGNGKDRPWRYRFEHRCSHGFVMRWCPVEGCGHYGTEGDPSHLSRSATSAAVTADGRIRCSSCRVPQDPEAFARDRSSATGWQGRCRACQRRAQTAWRAKVRQRKVLPPGHGFNVEVRVMTNTELLRMCCYIESGAPELCFESREAMLRGWKAHYHQRIHQPRVTVTMGQAWATLGAAVEYASNLGGGA